MLSLSQTLEQTSILAKQRKIAENISVAVNPPSIIIDCIRICIGDTFSLVETVVLLAQLLRRFEVRVAPGMDQVKPVAMVTVRPDRPVNVTLTAR